MTLITDKIDFLLDKTGDLDLTGGRLNFSTGPGSVAQGIRIRVMMIKGEWFANQSIGVPLIQRQDGTVTKAQALLGETFNQVKCEQAYRTVIATSPNVDKILMVSCTFDKSTRKMSIAWSVITSFGDTISDKYVTDVTE